MTFPFSHLPSRVPIPKTRALLVSPSEKKKKQRAYQIRDFTQVSNNSCENYPQQYLTDKIQALS